MGLKDVIKAIFFLIAREQGCYIWPTPVKEPARADFPPCGLSSLCSHEWWVSLNWYIYKAHETINILHNRFNLLP